MADVVGPTRRDLGTTSERTLEAPPPANPLRARVTRCAIPRIGTRPTRHAPAPTRGTNTQVRVSHDNAGQRGSATHKQQTRPGHIYTVQQGVGTIRQLPVAGTVTGVGRVAPGPAAATQMKVTSMTSVPGKPTAVTPSAPVGSEQLVAVAPFLCRQLS